MRTLTLRIKKKFFDLIKSGEKEIEYREIKPYYERHVRRGRVDRLKLHYQGTETLIVEVKMVTERDGFFEFHLGEVIR